MFKLSSKSINNMEKVHPDLVKVVKRAIELTPYDFGIAASSLRTLEEQQHLMATGRSKTMRSRHVPENNKCCLSCAVDVFVYDSRGNSVYNLPETKQHGFFRKVAQAFVTAAIEQGVQIELGCLWQSFIDGPHIQLSEEHYP